MIKVQDFVKIPNLLSLSRVILMIPFVIFFYRNDLIITLIIMILIVATDLMDGYVSRKLNQITDLGKVIDPVADKICLGIGMFVILIKANVFIWPIIFLICRDIVIMIFGVIIAKKQNEIPSSNIFGKLTSLSLSITGILFFTFGFFPDCSLGLKIAYGLYFVAIGLLFLSSISYLLKVIRFFKSKTQ